MRSRNSSLGEETVYSFVVVGHTITPILYMYARALVAAVRKDNGEGAPQKEGFVFMIVSMRIQRRTELVISICLLCRRNLQQFRLPAVSAKSRGLPGRHRVRAFPWGRTKRG